MKKQLSVMACAMALAMAPVASGQDRAYAIDEFVGGLIGGAIAGAVVATIVQAGQRHCHPGLGCHSHGPANPYHYHQFIQGPIVYYQAAPVAVAPPPPPPSAAAAYPAAHYNWCAGKYRSYDVGSNTFQPFGNVPRRPCISPFIQ